MAVWKVIDCLVFSTQRTSKLARIRRTRLTSIVFRFQRTMHESIASRLHTIIDNRSTMPWHHELKHSEDSNIIAKSRVGLIYMFVPRRASRLAFTVGQSSVTMMLVSLFSLPSVDTSGFYQLCESKAYWGRLKIASQVSRLSASHSHIIVDRPRDEEAALHIIQVPSRERSKSPTCMPEEQKRKRPDSNRQPSAYW